MRRDRRERPGHFGLGEDLLAHPWRWEPISREQAVTLCPWEPVVLLRSSPGQQARPEGLDEAHFLCSSPMARSHDGARYFRRVEPWPDDTGGRQVADVRPAEAAPDQILQDMEKAASDLLKQRPARPPEFAAPPRPQERRRLRLRLLDDATGEPLPGISLVVDLPRGEQVPVRTDAAGRIDLDAGQAVRLSLSVDIRSERGGGR